MAERDALRQARHLAAEIECPFCGEGDFDLNGLKGHLQGGCEAFENTASIHEMSDEEVMRGSEASRDFRYENVLTPSPPSAAETGGAS